MVEEYSIAIEAQDLGAVADALYGVSMTQDGVSRLVSLRLPRDEHFEASGAEMQLAAG